jgi:excisionase family DNA binding protein
MLILIICGIVYVPPMSERAPDRSVALASPADHLASGGPTRLTRDDVVDAREVSELLHLPRSTVFEYARRGVLPAHKLGRRWIFIRDEVEAAVRAAPNEVAHTRHQAPTSRASAIGG